MKRQGLYRWKRMAAIGLAAIMLWSHIAYAETVAVGVAAENQNEQDDLSGIQADDGTDAPEDETFEEKELSCNDSDTAADGEEEAVSDVYTNEEPTKNESEDKNADNYQEDLSETRGQETETAAELQDNNLEDHGTEEDLALNGNTVSTEEQTVDTTDAEPEYLDNHDETTEIPEQAEPLNREGEVTEVEDVPEETSENAVAATDAAPDSKEVKQEVETKVAKTEKTVDGGSSRREKEEAILEFSEFDDDGNEIITEKTETWYAQVSDAEDADDEMLLSAEELTAPRNFQWIRPGVIQFEAKPGQTAYYRVRLVEIADGGYKVIVTSNLGDIERESESYQKTEDGWYIVQHDYCAYIERDRKGKTVVVLGKAGENDDDKDFDTGAVSDYSPEYVYTVPSKQLSKPGNVQWSAVNSGTVIWEAVEHADQYYIQLYSDGKRTHGWLGKYADCKCDVSSQIGDVAAHEYYASVQAITKDITGYAASEPVNTVVFSSDGENQTPLETALSDISNANAEEAERAIRDLQNSIDLDEMKTEMQTDAGTREQVASLESRYMQAAGINVTTVVDENAGIPQGSASILGAALNAGAGADVTFNIGHLDESDAHILNPELYRNVTRFDMNIDGVETDADGNLKFPVTVTIPVPSYVKYPENIRILHYHHSDDGYDIIWPRYNSDSTISFTVTHFSEVTVAELDKLPFTDVPEDAWYYQYVKYAFDNKLMGGTSATSFVPNQSVTRGMGVQVLYNYAGQPSSEEPAFLDVKDTDWFAQAVGWAAAEGVVGGYTGNKFGPNDNLNREQLLVVLYNYSNKNGNDVSASADLSDFSDADKVDDWALTAVKWGIAEKIIGGKPDGSTGKNKIDPLGAATRAEFATIMRNYIEEYLKV